MLLGIPILPSLSVQPLYMQLCGQAVLRTGHGTQRRNMLILDFNVTSMDLR